MSIKLYNTFKCLLLVPVFILFVSNGLFAQQPILSLTPVITTGLNLPIQFVNAGDGTNRVFIVQQGGTIRAYDASFNFLSLFVTVSNVAVAGERGLLSMAFHPDYATNGFFFVYYTNLSGDLEVARYHVSSDANVADAASKVIVKTIPHRVNSNHNGGELHFGSDGFLYLSTGDGGGGGDQPNNAQNTSVLLGKMLRFNVNTSLAEPYFTIPAGNPFNNEIFDLGLRNPYRWSFDRQTNDMWIGDVGQDSYEEINFRAAGSTGGVNYGWRCYEGNSTFNSAGCLASSSYTFPVFAYPSQNPSAAVTGGLVYRGTASPALQGYYVAADFYSGVFYLILPDGSGGWNTSTQTLFPNGIVDFGEAENGEAYVVSLTSGAVYRLDGANGGPLPVTLAKFSGAVVDHAVKLNWTTATEFNLKQFEIEYSLTGDNFSQAGTVAASGTAGGSHYTFTHVINSAGAVFYRLKMLDKDGKNSYSGVVKLVLNDKNLNLVSPSLVTDGFIHINLSNTNYNSVEVLNANGVLMLTRKIEGVTGRVNIPASRLTPGVYLVRFNSQSSVNTEKIVVR